MKKTLVLSMLAAVLMLSGCMQYNMQFNPTTELKTKYPHYVSDRNLTVYYSVKQGQKSNMLTMAVQNTAGVYMRNVTINYDECCQTMHKGPGNYNYKNLGNIKNRAHKLMTLQIPKKAGKAITLKYNYTPIREDSFLRAQDSFRAPVNASDISGMINIYLSK
jgi:hypothetical protein